MADHSIPKPPKRLSRKRSFKLGLPLLCGGGSAEAVASRPAMARSASFGKKDGRRGELRRIFQHFDRDMDGKISGAELRAFFASMGDDMPPAADGGECLLDFAGFVALMEREGGQEEDLRSAFEVFDAAESAGRITPRGLQRVLGQLGDERSVADCEAMIGAYDVDGDGGLDFQEFRRMMS